MIADFALDFDGAAARLLLFHARQSLFQVTEPILPGLCGRAARDRVSHKSSLLRELLFS